MTYLLKEVMDLHKVLLNSQNFELIKMIELRIINKKYKSEIISM